MTARILIIAGSDSGGGAGIQADIKTVTMLGGHAMTAITAVTAQNTLGVEAVVTLPSNFVVQQMACVAEDIGVDAIKIGMLGGADIAHAVAKELNSGLYSAPLIFDPVMVSTSGASLADRRTIDAMDILAMRSVLVTPNLPELAILCGREIVDHGHAVSEAKDYSARVGAAVLIKGGHGKGDLLTDTLVETDGTITSWIEGRIKTNDTHGTGCTLATAIATELGCGLSLKDAIGHARNFVRMALHCAPNLGSGQGPLGQQAVRNGGELSGPSFNQVTLGASDYGASVAFYISLGLRQIVDSPDNGYARFEAANGATLSIHAGGVHAAGAVIYLESSRLDAWVGELVEAGLVIDQMPRDEDWLWREARLRDPHGNVICLYHAGENRRYPPWRVA